MKCLIIADKESDFSRLLQYYSCTEIMSFEQARHAELEGYDSIALLGGTYEKAITPHVDLRLKLEAFAESKKPLFLEWCKSFGYFYKSDEKADVAERMIYMGENQPDLHYGDLLDDQSNTLFLPTGVPSGARPLLYCNGRSMKHDHVDKDSGLLESPTPETWTLWYYNEFVLVCSFRFCDFIKARFAPFKRWQEIAKLIVRHLGLGEELPPVKPYYSLGGEGNVEKAFQRGMQWFENSNIYIDNGKSGVYEGLSHCIKPDGVQEKADSVRADCSSEVGGACFFDWLLYQKKESLEKYQNLTSFCYDKLQIKTGLFKGMIRWSTEAWGVCYQDDVARVLLPTLLSMKLTGDRTRLGEVEEALDFLISTTGTDGLRISRTDCVDFTEEKMKELKSKPAEFWCAHHNAFYHAVLLLAYQINGRQIYLDTAVKGLTSLMKVFPDTIREHSETQELCRLILPLACLYETTKEQIHQEWLYIVTERLEQYRHPSGGYVEWDTGYKANRSHTSDTESSLLADNGDEISDLLYSCNWLPLAFSYAYLATGDKYFWDKWKNISCFMASSQIISEDESLNGAWARAVDLKRMEIYGMPHDVGWGPFCVESGWTVAEILMGLGLGMVIEKGNI